MSNNASKTTITVKGPDGASHLIHSDEVGISALLDCLRRLASIDDGMEKDAVRYRWLRQDPPSRGWIECADTPEQMDERVDENMRHELSAAGGSEPTKEA